MSSPATSNIGSVGSSGGVNNVAAAGSGGTGGAASGIHGGPATAASQQRRLPSYINFDGTYDCFEIKFSLLSSSNFDFESVEAVGLLSKKKNNNNTSASGLTNLSSDGTSSPQDPSSAASLLHAAAPGAAAPAPSPALTAATAGSTSAASFGTGAAASADKPSGLLGQQYQQQTPPLYPTLSSGGNDSFISAGTFHRADSISLFEASPLAGSFTGKQQAGDGNNSKQQHQQQPSIAQLARQLYSDIDRFERQANMRFWLFRHSAEEGVSLFIFTHLSDLTAWIVDKAPELTEPWGVQQQHQHEEEEHEHHDRHRHHHHNHHHQQQQQQEHNEPTAAADSRRASLPSRANTECFDHRQDGDDDDDQEEHQQQQQQENQHDSPPQPHDEADRSSHSSSTVGTRDGENIDTTYWLDIQTQDYDVLLEILRLFPSLRRETFDSFRNEENHRHTMRHFSHVGYLSCIFACATHAELSADGEFLLVDDDEDSGGLQDAGGTGGEDGTGGGGSGKRSAAALAAEAKSMDKHPSMQQQIQKDNDLLKIPRRTRMCCAVSQQLAITFHKEPVRGLGHVCKRLHMAFRPVAAAGMTRAQRESLGGADNQQQQYQQQQQQQQEVLMMTPGWVLSMLYQQAVAYIVPNISQLSHTIEQLDAKILLASADAALESDASSLAENSSSSSSSNNNKSSASMLSRVKRWWTGSGRSVHDEAAATNPLIVRVARFRRGIAEHRANISRKEHLTSLLISPKVQVCAYLTDNGTQQRLHDVLPVVQRTLQQLDSLRELLTQSNTNLMSQVSIAQARSSNKMSRDMTNLSVVATATMPLSLVAGAFGMNCNVPWSANTTDSLVPFFVIVAVMVVWIAASFYAVRFFR